MVERDRGDPGPAPWRDRGHLSADQPANEWNAPSGFGSTGVNGLNAYTFVVSKPALAAAGLSANGVRAVIAWLIDVHFSVRSYPLLFGGSTLSALPSTPVIISIGPPSAFVTSGPRTRASVLWSLSMPMIRAAVTRRSAVL